jgi:hypothetical protein
MKLKINTTIFNRLVDDFNKSIELCKKLSEDDTRIADYISELSKASGTLTVLSQEAVLLVGDIAGNIFVSPEQIKELSKPVATTTDFLNKLLGPKNKDNKKNN